MKFIATTDGYINADYVKRFDITDKKIALQDNSGMTYFIDEKFDSDEAAQNYLDELNRQGHFRHLDSFLKIQLVVQPTRGRGLTYKLAKGD